VARQGRPGGGTLAVPPPVRIDDPGGVVLIDTAPANPVRIVDQVRKRGGGPCRGIKNIR
jgi:hypothetical protein